MLLKNNSFALLVLSRLLINIADSLFYIVTLWYISSKSPILTGVAVLCFTIPENFLIFVGPIIDRFNPKKILLVSSIAQVGLISTFLILFRYDLVNTYMLLGLVLISTFLSAITYPIEETMVPQIVKKGQLVKANSIIEVTYKIADFLFNGIAGILVSIFTIGVLYKLNLILFALPILFIKLIDFKREAAEEEDDFNLKQYKKDLLEGLKFLSQKRFISLILPIIIINFFFVMTTVGLPFFARKFENPEFMFGLLMSVSAIGGFCGAIVSNALKTKFGAGKVITIGLILQGLFWLPVFMFSNKAIILISLFISYLFFGSTNIMFASLFQSMIPSNLLGRANSAIDTAITLSMPIGSVIAGALITFLPVDNVMILYGGVSICSGIYYFSNKNIYLSDIKDDEDILGEVV